MHEGKDLRARTYVIAKTIAFNDGPIELERPQRSGAQ